MKNSRRVSAGGIPRAKTTKRSKIWEMFTPVPNDVSKAVCKKCSNVISRGGGSSSKSQCTTNMWKHFENRHVAEFMMMKKYKETVNHPSKANHLLGGTDKSMDSISIRSDFKFFDSLGIWELFSVNPQDPTLLDCRECGTLQTVTDSDEDLQKTIWSHIIDKHPDFNSEYRTSIIEKSALNRGNQRPSVGNRRSSVWDEFTQHPLDVCKVICNTCETVVSRGQTKDRLNITNMRRHLASKTHQSSLHKKIDENTPSSEPTENRVNGGRGDNMSEDHYEAINTAINSNIQGLRQSSSDTETPDCSEVESVGLLSARKVDLVHTGLLGNALYEQQKNGMCCDFSIILQYKIPAPLSARNVQGDEAATSMVDCTHKYKIHSCIACIVSRKLKSLIESRFDKITLTDINRDVVQAFIEIMYTGKLESVYLLKKQRIQEIYNLAQLFIAPTVTDYLKRCNPKLVLLDPDEEQNVERNVISMRMSASEIIGELETGPTIVSECPPTLSPSSTTSDQHALSALNVRDELNSEEQNPGSYSNISKVSKRKNYVPVANAVSYKKIKYEPADDIPSQ